MTVGHWCGCGGTNNPARMLAWVLTEGGYEKLWQTNLKLAVEAGCDEIWIHHPAGNTRAPDGTTALMEFDQFSLAAEDPTVPTFITPANYVAMCRKLVAVRTSIKLTSYFGNPGWAAMSKPLMDLRKKSPLLWRRRTQVTQNVILDVPRHGMCIDGLNEANPTASPYEYDYLRGFKNTLASYGRGFHGEHGGNIWWNPCWADVAGGLVPYSGIKDGSLGVVPPGKVGYAFDNLETHNQSPAAMREMVERCQSLGYTPLLFYPAWAKARAA